MLLRSTSRKLIIGTEPLLETILPAIGLNLPGKFTVFGTLYMFISDAYLGHEAAELNSSTFHGDRYAPRQDNNWSGLAKLTWKMSPTTKLIISGKQSVSINQNAQSLQTNLEFVEPSPGYPYSFQNLLDNANTFTLRFANSSLSFAVAPSSVVHTGVKSAGCEKSTPQPSPR